MHFFNDNECFFLIYVTYVLMAVVFVLLHRYLATTVEGRDTNEHYIVHTIVSEYTLHSKRYMYIVDFFT